MFEYDCLIITKDGLVKNSWNSEKQCYERKPLENDAVLRNLRNDCEIEEGVTLLDIMKLVQQNDILTMILGEYSWCWDIDVFHSQVNEPMRTSEKSNMKHLEICWEVHNHDGSISLSSAFHGWGYDPELEREGGYGIGFTPLYDLADYPVKLNKTINVYPPLSARVKSRNLGPILETTQHFSLLEILDAIYWEVSFYGGPDEKVEELEELQDRINEIDRGEAELIPFEEVMGQFRDESDYEVDLPDFIDDYYYDNSDLNYFDFEQEDN